MHKETPIIYDKKKLKDSFHPCRGSAESSLSTSEPLISRKDLLLMTSKKAKEMAAIMRKRLSLTSLKLCRVIVESQWN